MTPYVRFQELLINWLEKLQEEQSDILHLLISACKAKESKDINWPQILRSLGFVFADEEWHKQHSLPVMILEQVERKEDGQPHIRGLLGFPLHSPQVYNTLEKWAQNRSGSRVRTKQYAHVGALVPDDRLINGDRVLSPPREGGNGAVLLHLSGGAKGYWFSYPAKTILTLAGCHDGSLPDELLK